MSKRPGARLVASRWILTDSLSGSTSIGVAIMGLVVLVLMFGVIYMLVIVPNQRRQKAHRELLASLEVGDVVVTSAGIHGAVAEIEDTIVWLEVAPEVELKVAKASVTERIPDDDDDDADDKLDDEYDDEDELEAADASDDEG